jgi:hypothetical protein
MTTKRAPRAANPRVEKKPIGRPTKYESRFCGELEADMAEGYSVTAFAGKIGVSRQTIDDWTKAHPEFLEALSRAKAKRLRFWEQTGIAVASKGTGGPGAATVITFGLKNMGGDEWSAPDKHEHAGPGGKDLPASTVNVLPTDKEALKEALREVRDEF